MFTVLPLMMENVLKTPIKSKVSRCDLVTIYSIYLANILKRILEDQPWNFFLENQKYYFWL